MAGTITLGLVFKFNRRFKAMQKAELFLVAVGLFMTDKQIDRASAAIAAWAVADGRAVAVERPNGDASDG